MKPKWIDQVKWTYGGKMAEELEAAFQEDFMAIEEAQSKAANRQQALTDQSEDQIDQKSPYQGNRAVHDEISDSK